MCQNIKNFIQGLGYVFDFESLAIYCWEIVSHLAQ